MIGTYPTTQTTQTVQLQTRHNLEDDEWDEFLGSAPGGELLQSSLWAKLKATTGWSVVRIVAMREDHMVGGAQILLRPLPFPLGAIGYLPRGPVLATEEPEVATLVIRQARTVARRQRIQCLFVQAPPMHPELARKLSEWGFQSTPTKTKIAPESTLRLDLRPNADELLANMRRGTRANIRRSERAGMRVREGTEADLGVFSRLHAASGDRQGFSTASEAYFSAMWRVFAPSGRIRLFITEREGEDISALLILGFGNSVWAKRLGWSGKHGKYGPNEALLWNAMLWAKENGYRYFDHDGISVKAAAALTNGEPLPTSVKRTPTYFKLGFGGEALLFPSALAYVYNPMLRYGYTALFPKLDQWSLTKKLITRLRLG